MFALCYAVVSSGADSSAPERPSSSVFGCISLCQAGLSIAGALAFAISAEPC
jgi:hypothetical protein